MSDYTGSTFISAPVEEELTGLTTLINDNKDANAATQAALDQEIYDRGAADNNLQNDINNRATQAALSAEINTRSTDDSALSLRITNTADSLGTTNARLDQEVIDRTNADATLQSDINSRATQASLSNEINTRTADDIALGVRITDNTTLIGTTRTELAQEVADRIAADINLQNQINPLATQTSLNNEINTRTADDIALGVRITDNTTLIGTTRTELAQETTDRQSADTTLQNEINDRALTLSLNNEITAREDADTALGVRIDFEASARQYYISNLQGQIDVNETAITTEETARTNADAGLQASITANATAIASKANDTDVVKLSGTQTINGEKFFTNDTRIGGDVILPTDEGKVVLGSNNDRKIYWTAEGLGTNHAFRATRYDVAGGQQIASNNLADGDTLVKLLDGTVAIDGDVNLTAGAYKIDNVSIPTHDDLALKAPIDNSSLTGNTQMTRLTVNHSDATTIGLDFNNTNVNQYAGSFNTAGYGWRFFNDNTSQVNNNTFGVFTKGTGSQLNPLLVKNDGKLYTLDQEVNGNINLSAGNEFKIDGVPLSGGMTPEQEAELTSTTSKVDSIYDISPVTLQNVNFTNSVWNIGLNNVILHIQDAMAIGQVPQDRITNLPADIAAKRALTNNTFPLLNLDGTTQYMTAAGGTINFSDYFTEFDLTGLVNTDLVVGIDETTIEYQTKCIFIKTDDPSNTTGNLIIRSNKILTDQDIILRKKGDCVFLHADWNSSRWKVLGIFSNVQQSLTTTQNIVSEMNIICQQNLMSNSSEPTYITGFSNINLRTPDSGAVPTISIDGQEAFMTKGTNQTISGIKTFENGIITDEVVTESAHDLVLKTADTTDSVIIDNGSTVGFTQTATKTSLNRALNIPYASVPLGTSTANKSPPTGSSSGDIYRDNANGLFIVP